MSLEGLRHSPYTITDKAAAFASHPRRIRVLLVVLLSLTVLKVLETFILDFELEWVDEQSGIVQYVHGRDVDGRHAALSGPASLKLFDGTGSVRDQCALFRWMSFSLMRQILVCFCFTLFPPSQVKTTPWRPAALYDFRCCLAGERPSCRSECFKVITGKLTQS